MVFKNKIKYQMTGIYTNAYPFKLYGNEIVTILPK